ncbi:MAG: hypothetical protein ABI925_04155 [Verrucomicrobiota bacterium]
MKLFRKGGSPPETAEKTPPPVKVAETPPRPPPLPALREISLSDEQKRLLETPINPRVDRVLQELNAVVKSPKETELKVP